MIDFNKNIDKEGYHSSGKAYFNILSENNESDLVQQTTRLSAIKLIKLPKELRSEILKKWTKESLPAYYKFHNELFVDETGDGIE